MPTTEGLIAILSGSLEPVHRLGSPVRRALTCILFATTLILVLALLQGFRADLGRRLGIPAYLVQVAGAWLTGVAATIAAFNVSLPDRSRIWFLLPLPFVGVWLSGLAYGCLGDWIAIPAGAPVVADSVSCLETIIMATLPLSIALWFMLRRAKPLQPSGTAWMGGLAVAGFADTAHLLTHVVEASLLVLVINLVPVALIVLLGRLASGAIRQSSPSFP